MNSEHLQKLLNQDLFRGLTATAIEELTAHVTTVTVAAGNPVFESGAEERALYFLLEGTVEIELIVPFVTEVVLDELAPVCVFGESSFFHGNSHSVTARALTEVTVARLERSDYDRLLDTNSLAACRLGANAAEVLAAKLQRTDAWIVETMQTEEAHRVRQKFWDFRQELGHRFDRPEGGGFSAGAGWRA